MTSRTFPFTNNGVRAFTIGHVGERVSVLIGPHEHSTTLHMSAAEARAMATAPPAPEPARAIA